MGDQFFDPVALLLSVTVAGAWMLFRQPDVPMLPRDVRFWRPFDYLTIPGAVIFSVGVIAFLSHAIAKMFLRRKPS